MLGIPARLKVRCIMRQCVRETQIGHIRSVATVGFWDDHRARGGQMARRSTQELCFSMVDILTRAPVRCTFSSTGRLRTMLAALLTAAGLLPSAFGAVNVPPATLNSTESLLIGSWEGDLLSDLAGAWPNGGDVPPGQRNREVIELRADRTVVIHPRCVDHHDGIVIYFQAFQLRWSLTPDLVLHWHSDPAAADLLGGTIPMVIEGSTLRLPGGVGKELVLTRYSGELPPPECQFRRG
jgi:hypothetical protein